MSCKSVFVKNSAKRILMTLLLLLAVCNFTGVTCAEAAENRRAGSKTEQGLSSKGSAVQHAAVSHEKVRSVAGESKPAASVKTTAVTAVKDSVPLPAKTTVPSIVRKSVKISAVGDCTIGWDDRFSWGNRFDAYLESNNGDYSYYLAKVREVFREDDFTIANLETTFTSYPVKMEKTFNFSAPDAYKNVLLQGCIDAVSLGNNHTYDFGERGYLDTMAALDSIGIPYFGHDKYLVKEVCGVKIGLFSLLDYGCQFYHEIDKALTYLKSQKCDLIIACMHWGVEHTYEQTWAQVTMAHYLIDNGVDLVLGSHPHVLQGIEKYKGKYILYSMANFCFGGNTDPDDKDTMIFQQTFTFVNGELQPDDYIKIIPASVSGVSYCNNYQPVVLEGAEKERVMQKIMRYSSGFEYRE
ncbi:MAG: CapA family protein [Acidaminococcaceae bacterium]|nr:CapA family protein [Acidaminococcaceae bacterium]